MTIGMTNGMTMGMTKRMTIGTTFGMDKTTPTRIMGAKSGTVTNLDFRKKKKMKLDKELIGSRMMMNYLKFGGESHGSWNLDHKIV